MQHLAIIPDGNRRWAAQNKLKAFFGHKRGMESVERAIKVCLDNGVKYLSFYTFSLENFNRKQEEKTYLFNLLAREFQNHLPRLKKQKVQVRFLGDRSYFPAVILPTVERVEAETKDGDALQLNLLFCYGGQQDLVQAVRQLASKVKGETMSLSDITEKSIRDRLWTGDMPDPDLIIRTGNVVRLSNFFLYQAAYSEFLFLNCFWPEITEEILQNSIQKFVDIKRNFGH